MTRSEITQSLDGPELMTPDEVAEYLRIDVRTVYILMRVGSLQGYQVTPKRLRLKREEVEKYVNRKLRRNA